MIDKRKLLGELLVEKGVITQDQLNSLLAEIKKGDNQTQIGWLLVEKGYATDEDVARCLSEQLNVPYNDLSNLVITEELINLLPEDILNTHQVIPLERMGDYLLLAMVNPIDIELIDRIQSITNLRITPALTTAKNIKKALIRYIPSQAQSITSAAKGTELFSSLDVPDANNYSKEKINIFEGHPLYELFNKAMLLGATDIHIGFAENKSYYRFKAGDVLREKEVLSSKLNSSLITFIRSIFSLGNHTDLQEEKVVHRKINIKVTFDKKELTLSISKLQTATGMHLLFNILNSNHLLSLDSLQIEPDILTVLKQLINNNCGVICLNGPRHSGKTTTFYSILNNLKMIETYKDIFTLEKEIGHTIPGIYQTKFRNCLETNTFDTLEAILEHNPDMLFIDLPYQEKESLRSIFDYAIRGHLTVMTMQTPNAFDIPEQFISAGVDTHAVNSTLKGILSQRLLRVLCPKCKKAYQPNEKELHLLAVLRGQSSSPNSLIINSQTPSLISNPQSMNPLLYKPVGCKNCHDIGYKGQIAIFELLVIDEQLQRVIQNQTTPAQLKQAAMQKGIKTISANGLDKVLMGITSLAELCKVMS